MPGVDYRVIVLGSGQDGGVPQLGSGRLDVPERTASSVAVVGGDGTAVLIDASPDLRPQYRRLLADPAYGNRSRVPAFDAVLLTHAHMGHYAGLVHFGKEAHAARGVPCHATAGMLGFLGRNEPWATLFREGRLGAVPIRPGDEFEPALGLRAVAHAVRHRHEHSDNVGFELTGASGGSLLYVPDVDRWEDWPAAEEILDRVDTALIDGTFFDGAEHPDRNLGEVPHPLVSDTVARFRHLTASTRMVFTHLNWTNRLCDPKAPEHETLRAAGFTVAADGMEVAL